MPNIIKKFLASSTFLCHLAAKRWSWLLGGIVSVAAVNAHAVVVEFFDPDLNNYFITADPTEQAFVDSGAVGRWQRTGNTFAAGGPNQVCRFYGNSNINQVTGVFYGPNSHFYTADPAECAGLKAQYTPTAKSWKFESNDFLTTSAVNGTCPVSLVPVYRAYNNGFAKGIDSNHRITSNFAAYQQNLVAGSIGEGIVMCAPAVPKIMSISVCSLTGAGGSGSCPTGTADTHQIVLAFNGSGTAINTLGVGGTSDEHSSVFSPGTLGSNNDYVFFVASGNKLNPDIGATVLSGGMGPNQNGQWTFDFPQTDGYGSYPTGYGTVFLAPTLQGHCPTVADGNPAHQDQTFDIDYAAPGSVVQDPTAAAGSLLMIYEGTTNCFGSTGGSHTVTGGSFYSTLGIATSLDYGKTWPTYRGTQTFSFVALPDANKTQGPNAPLGARGAAVCMGNNCAITPPASYGRYAAISPPYSIASIMATGKPLANPIADSEPAAFVDDVSTGSGTYLYTIQNYAPGGLNGDFGGPPLPNGRKHDLTVARARLNGGTAPLSFLKWSGQSFAAPGIGGPESPILPDGSFANCGAAQTQSRSGASLSYVEATQQYLLFFICESLGDPAAGKAGAPLGSAWFYATSYDLSTQTQWSAPQEVIGSWSPWDQSGGCPSFKGWYPTLMSLASKPGHLSTTGYVFFLWGCEGDGTNPPKRQYSSRAFTIATQP